MKRVLGIVILGVGVALAVFAASLRFYVTPIATNIPYDLEPSTTIAEASNGIYLAVGASGARIETGALRSTTYIVPQPGTTRDELTGDLAGSAVVWDVYDQIVDISSGTVVTASSSEIALDRKTGAYVEWDGTWLNTGGDDEPASFEGHSYKLPFNTEQITYPYWDDQLGETVDLNFVAVEQFSGLEAYKFESSVPETQIDYDADSLGALRALIGGGSGDIYYSVDRTIWVEPVTGQFLNVQQTVNLEFRGGNDTTRVLLGGDFEYTQETQDNAAATITENRDLLLLVSQTLPLGVGGGGVLLIIVGVILIATGRSKAEAGEPAAATTATVGA